MDEYDTYWLSCPLRSTLCVQTSLQVTRVARGEARTNITDPTQRQESNSDMVCCKTSQISHAGCQAQAKLWIHLQARHAAVELDQQRRSKALLMTICHALQDL